MARFVALFLLLSLGTGAVIFFTPAAGGILLHVFFGVAIACFLVCLVTLISRKASHSIHSSRVGEHAGSPSDKTRNNK